MQRVRQVAACPAIIGILLLGLLPTAVSADTPVSIAGSRATLPAGYGQTGDFGAAGASTQVLGRSGQVLTDITGTCAGCDTAFGSGSGYRAIMQLKDQASGDFINVGVTHDTATNATGSDPSALTLVIETGRKTGTGYDFSQGYVTTMTNRVLGGHAQVLLIMERAGRDGRGQWRDSAE